MTTPIPRHPIDTPPWCVLRNPADFGERRRILRQVLEETGVQLGEHDQLVSNELARAGIAPVTVASWLLRAFDAGRAVQPALTVTLDLSDEDTYFVLVQALCDFADHKRAEAAPGEDEAAARLLTGWAAAADSARERIEAALDPAPPGPASVEPDPHRDTPAAGMQRSTDAVYQQLRALTSWALESKGRTDPQSWFDAPETFASLVDELDRRLASGEPLPDVWGLLRQGDTKAGEV